MLRPRSACLTFLLSFSVLMIGCGKQSSVPESKGELLQGPTAVQPEEVFADAKVTCNNPRRCPGYLAMVVTSPEGNDSRPDTCTGFLIEKDLLVTSAECLPASLRKKGLSCRRKIQVFFPRTAQNQIERVGCSEVVSVSPAATSETSTSYAFLRLNQPINVDVPKISHEGFKDEGIYWTHRIQLISNTTLQAKIRSRSCHAVQGSMALPTFTQDTAPQVSLRGCAVEGSARGAPVMDREDRIRGILHSAPAPSRMSLVQDEILYGTALPLVFATNMACVPDPGSERPLPVACNSIDEEVDLANILRERLDSLRVKEEPRLRQQLEAWEKQSKMPFLRWKFSGVGQDDAFTPEPDCFISPATGWAQPFRRQDVDVQFDLPIWRLRVGLDLHLRPISQVFVDRYKQASFAFNAFEVVKYGATRGVLSGESVIRKERVIRICK